MYEEFDDYDLSSKLNFKLWKKIIKSLAPYKKIVTWGLIAVAVLTFIETYFVKLISEYGFGKFINGESMDGFSSFIILMIAMVVFEVVFVKIYVFSAAKIEMYLYRQLTGNCFAHLQELSYSFFDKYSVGWLISRTTNDTSRVSEIISWGLVDAISCVFKLIFILVIMIVTNAKLSLIMIIVVPTILTIGIFFRRIVMKYSWKVRKAHSQVSSALNEGISGAKTSKSLVLEEKNLSAFSRIVDRYKRFSIKAAFINSSYYQILAVLAAAGIASMAYFGGIEVVSGRLDYAILFMFVSYTMMFFDPVLTVSRVSNEMKMAQVAAERVYNIIAIEPELMDSEEVIKKYGDYTNPKKENWEKINGDIEFKNVSFKYSTGPTILKNFNLKVKCGMSVALVGETGAGKSTIVNLLSRFYEPTDGEILIDGIDYRKRSIGWLHANLGYVMQTPHLFSGTIKDNIRFGNLEATDEQVVAAAKAANAHEFIGLLEKGYDTEVGESGNRLSQGQKQLISFARAIIANPSILILDEATSSIDTQTEYVIQKAIGNLLKGRTSFIIAHRLSTITNSDLILVVQNGQITEMGKHEELMELKGYYYRLYTNQFVEDRLKEINII